MNIALLMKKKKIWLEKDWKGKSKATKRKMENAMSNIWTDTSWNASL